MWRDGKARLKEIESGVLFFFFLSVTLECYREASDFSISKYLYGLVVVIISKYT